MDTLRQQVDRNIAELQHLAWCIKAATNRLKPQILQWDNDDYASLHALRVLVEAEAAMVRQLMHNAAEHFLVTRGPSAQEG